ncbi:ParB/RepB/Spo0J family partition protein [Pseudarthrobacter sp. P1]|uniref:ParB/RepB/Spo0J family partition protein n=1 Tax=Pseudarthrobacter sp. P1 TaxID=3418418 RepID=UPI003CEA51DC
MTEKRRGLGRGLGALIPNAAGDEADGGTTTATVSRPVDLFFPEPKARQAATSTAVSRETRKKAEPLAPLLNVPGAQFLELPVGDIHPNRKQPRTVFNEEDMAELVHSVREIGVLQPIVVRKSAEKGAEPYELVMGERRWRATQAAGLATIPVIVRDTEDNNLLRDALLENLHRSQLNPLEEAAAYQQLLEDFGTTHEQLADRIGRSRPQVSNTLRLLKLPVTVQRRVAAGVLSAGHARALLALPDAAAIERVAQRIVAEGISVRGTEEAVAMYQAPDEAARVPAAKPSPRHERLDFLATSLADRLDTNVKISLGARKGKVSIEFASVEDLNRIMDVLSPASE